MRSPLFFALVSILLAAARISFGQDLHYSQFYLNTQHYSPAAAGIFEGSVRVAGAYRAQWASVPVHYMTYAVSADWKMLRREKSLVALGMLLQQDQAGDARLSWGQGGLNLSAAHALGKNSLVSAGFGIAAAQRNVSLGGLYFKNNWGSDGFDPSLPSREPFERSSGMSPTLSAGMAYHWQPGRGRSRASLGAGAFHLNRPSVSLGGFEQARLPVRLAFFGEGLFQYSEAADLVAVAAFQSMKTAKEMMVGAGIRQILTNELANFTALRGTLSYRLGDAVVPAVQLERNNWTVGVSYDWNVSPFNEATQGRGGIEIAAVWRWVPVPPPPVVKCCPIF